MRKEEIWFDSLFLLARSFCWHICWCWCQSGVLLVAHVATHTCMLEDWQIKMITQQNKTFCSTDAVMFFWFIYHRIKRLPWKMGGNRWYNDNKDYGHLKMSDYWCFSFLVVVMVSCWWSRGISCSLSNRFFAAKWPHTTNTTSPRQIKKMISTTCTPLFNLMSYDPCNTTPPANCVSVFRGCIIFLIFFFSKLIQCHNNTHT